MHTVNDSDVTRARRLPRVFLAVGAFLLVAGTGQNALRHVLPVGWIGARDAQVVGDWATLAGTLCILSVIPAYARARRAELHSVAATAAAEAAATAATDAASFAFTAGTSGVLDAVTAMLAATDLAATGTEPRPLAEADTVPLPLVPDAGPATPVARLDDHRTRRGPQ
jgi:hypothetical protein